MLHQVGVSFDLYYDARKHKIKICPFFVDVASRLCVNCARRLESVLVSSSVVEVIIIIITYLFTAIGLLPGGSGYFTCKQNMKFVTTKFKLGGLHEKHVVATWNLENHLSICL